MPKASAVSWDGLGDEDMLKVEQLATLLGVSKSKLDKARTTGTGPKYAKLGRQVRYLGRDVRAWVSSNVRDRVAYTVHVGGLPEPWEIERWLTKNLVR